MKKLAIALVAALVLALAAPALAADINLGGSLETRFNFGPKNAEEPWKDWGIEADNGMSMKLDVNAGDRIRVGLEFGEERIGLDEDDELDEGHNDPTGEEPGQLDITLEKAYLETTGAFWNGGPELVTTLGDIDVDFNDYVGSLSDGNGIKVEGLEVGPVNARAFYAWDQGQVGAAVDTTYADIDLGAAVVTDGENIEAAGSAGTEISGVKVKAEAAMDEGSNFAYKLTGETEVMPNVTVKGGYRDSENFSSQNAKLDDDDEPVAYDNEKGFNVGVATTQYGIDMEANYDQPTEKVTFSADKELELAGLNIKGEYDAKFIKDQAIEHKVKVTSPMELVPQLQGLELSAGATINKDNTEGENSWNVGADYEAPNGINVGAKYHSNDGPSAYAGLKVEF
ncbi:MAG: hypothetical protein GX998_07090 [Firmicutes bacterium]|nr:hypothetical protein [Bacillota bacterium]